MTSKIIHNRQLRLTICFTIVLLTVVHFSCNKSALNLPPPTASEASSFTTENDFKQGVIGVYAMLSDYYSSSNSGGGSGSAELETFFLPGDDLTNNGTEAYEDFGNAINPAEGKLSQVFASSYILCNRANKILQKINEVKDGVYTTPNLRNYNKGEVLFMRAFAHYMLWNLFGTAPLDTVVVASTSQLNPPSSKGTELLDQAITDLTEAATLLPPSWDAANLGRVTANSANGLLGKCLVFRATAKKSTDDYSAALTAFNKLTGVHLVDNFEDNFDVTKENNAESLFEYQAGATINGATNAWLSNDQADIGVASGYWQMFYNSTGTYMGGGLYTATAKLVSVFNVDDPRLPYTVKTSDSTITKYILHDESNGAVNSNNNARILRYADVLLLQAEATLQSGGSTAAAIGFINQVRTRARAMVSGGTQPVALDETVTDKNTILQWIMDERLRELAAEGQRWFDIRRWAIGGLITLDNNFFSSITPTRIKFDAHHLYFPIPYSETDKNPNITQNSGY